MAHKYGLYKHIRFNSVVDEARWDDASNKWHTIVKRFRCKDDEIGDSYTITSDFLISAVGQLSAPKYPAIKGLASFQGKIMHSARWDWDYDIRGKRVGIIGTGATAAQIIPEIARECDHLIVFQRTPAWVMPRHDRPISQTRRKLYKHAPFARKRYRASLMDFRESIFDAAFDPENAKHDYITSLSRQHMLDQLPGDSNAGLRCALTPNYPFSCKRIVVSDDYYPSMSRNGVLLETSGISEITPTGATTQTGTHHPFDLLILATGFKTTQFMYPIRIYGADGRSLSEIWSKGASAYLGITVESLPNFGMLYGPNTNLAHNSLILQIEAQSLYLNTLISAVLQSKRQGKTLRLEPKHEIAMAYNEDVQARLARSTFADPTCSSWFKDEHGRITNNWCGSAVEYQKRTSFVDWSDYDILGSGAAQVESKGKSKWRRRVEETQISDRALGIGVGCSIAVGLGVGCLIWGL